MRRATLMTTLAVTGAALTLAAPMYGQGYRIRIDTRFQSIAYRGFALDSVLAADVDTLPTGELRTTDGFTVHCPVGDAYCGYFRPGPERRGSPIVSTVDGVVWGFGIRGLRLVAKARVGTDLGDMDVWPGTKPVVQLLEGYAEFRTRLLTAQVGRTHVTSRLGFTGIDGAKAEIRPFGPRLQFVGFGGLGFAQGTVLPVTSEALDPLGDFRPPARQLIFGGGLGWTLPTFEGRALYQREIDPDADHVVAERATFDAALRTSPGVTIAGGAYYDIAAGEWGTAEASITYAAPRGLGRAGAGARRYRPHFELWTIWGAFSPVPYTAGFGWASVAPVPGLELRTRAEIYDYDAADAATPLADVEEDGWRLSLGATVSRLAAWTFQAGYYIDKGVGGRALGFDGTTTFEPIPALHITAHAEHLKRPLEFRFDDARVWSYGLRADYETRAGVRLNAEVRRYDETRERDDAARLDLDQWRVNLGFTIVLGSSADVRRLHPAILRIPEGRRAR